MYIVYNPETKKFVKKLSRTGLKRFVEVDRAGDASVFVTRGGVKKSLSRNIRISDKDGTIRYVRVFPDKYILLYIGDILEEVFTDYIA